MKGVGDIRRRQFGVDGLVFRGRRSPATMDLLDRVVEKGAHAPQLWPIEALNALLTAKRRRRISAAKRQELLGFLHALPIAIDAENATRVWHEVALLAAAYGLTAYDATYLELAARRNLPLATADRALRAAAAKAGVALHPE